MRKCENLNGIWEFAYFGDNAPQAPFVTDEFMPVPSCFDLMEPHCGKRGYALYRREVVTGGLVELFIDGLGISAEIFFDGKSIRKLPYTYMPEKIVFDAGNEGKHELAILLCNKYDAQFQPNFDFFGYGGIYGDVTLTRLNPTYLSRILISTEDYTCGKIRLQLSASQNYTGKGLLTFDTGYKCEVGFAAGKADLTLNLPDYKLWSVDTPNLHTVTVNIGSDEITETFGIREFTASGRKLLINGKAVKLLGVNRHESHPTFGAAMPPQLIAYDLRLLKEAGHNYIRGSHYPQRKTFLDLCDKMGFFVWEETLGWDVKAPKLHSPEFLETQLDEAEKLTYSSFNHPSIVIRGFLNENESEKQETRALIQAVKDKIRSIDPHCLITYASNRYQKDVCTDIPDVIAMNPYPGWYDSCDDEISGIHNVQRVLQELSDAMPKDKPFLITEIGAEALYGFRDPIKARWTEDYQAKLLEECCNYAMTNEDCAGISIWHFADTRSYIATNGIYGRARGYNNKGIMDEFRRPKLAWDAVSRIAKEKLNK